MTGTGILTMSVGEIDRLKVIQAVVDGKLKLIQAASRLALTTRQIQRLVNRYRADGVAGLVSKKRGQDLSTAQSPKLYWRADPDRWERPSLL